jgi:hypothetical protein
MNEAVQRTENIIHLGLPQRIYDHFVTQSCFDDDAVLLARLRLTASNIELTLQMRDALIPQASCTARFRRVGAVFRSDLELCEAWLRDGKPTLEELHLIVSILNKWNSNNANTNPYWRLQPTPQQAELNQKIVEVIDRLIERGQFTTDEEHTE